MNGCYLCDAQYDCCACRYKELQQYRKNIPTLVVANKIDGANCARICLRIAPLCSGLRSHQEAVRVACQEQGDLLYNSQFICAIAVSVLLLLGSRRRQCCQGTRCEVNKSVQFLEHSCLATPSKRHSRTRRIPRVRALCCKPIELKRNHQHRC